MAKPGTSKAFWALLGRPECGLVTQSETLLATLRAGCCRCSKSKG